MSKYATKQRKLLLDYLTCHTDEPLTAEQIARDLAPAAISVSAIYRNLAQLEAEGSVRRVSAEGSRKTLYRYRDADVCADHLHLACARCGKTYHTDAAASTQGRLECQQWTHRRTSDAERGGAARGEPPRPPRQRGRSLRARSVPTAGGRPP